MRLLKNDVSMAQSRDAGMALALILLLLAWLISADYFLPLGIGVLIVTMAAPGLFKPFAKFWFGLSHVMGSIVSRILLSVLFYSLVTPVGFVRRIIGKDAMQLKSWKKNHASVFKTRDHLFKPQDLDHPY